MGQVWSIPFSLIPPVYHLAPVQGLTRGSLDLNKSPIHGFGKGYKLNIYIKREVGLAETFNKRFSHFCVCKLYGSLGLSVHFCPLFKEMVKFLETSWGMSHWCDGQLTDILERSQSSFSSLNLTLVLE